MKNKWVKKDGDRIIRITSNVKDETAEVLKLVSIPNAVPEKILQDLKKRKLVLQVTRKSYKVCLFIINLSFSFLTFSLSPCLTLFCLSLSLILSIYVSSSLKVHKGPEFKPRRVKKMAELGKEMLGDKLAMNPNTHWSDLEFKTVNLNAMGSPPLG